MSDSSDSDRMEVSSATSSFQEIPDEEVHQPITSSGTSTVNDAAEEMRPPRVGDDVEKALSSSVNSWGEIEEEEVARVESPLDALPCAWLCCLGHTMCCVVLSALGCLLFLVGFIILIIWLSNPDAFGEEMRS